jgi:hypothetical protein
VKRSEGIAAKVTDVTDGAGLLGNVNVGLLAGWTAKLGWFSFPGLRASEVYWDPSLAADIDASTTVVASLGLILLLLFACL